MATDTEVTTPSAAVTNAFIEEIPAVIKETKAGYKTTEFWASIVSAALVVSGVIPQTNGNEGVIVAIITAIYALSRGLAKQGVPDVEDKPKVS